MCTAVQFEGKALKKRWGQVSKFLPAQCAPTIRYVYHSRVDALKRSLEPEIKKNMTMPHTARVPGRGEGG